MMRVFHTLSYAMVAVVLVAGQSAAESPRNAADEMGAFSHQERFERTGEGEDYGSEDMVAGEPDSKCAGCVANGYNNFEVGNLPEKDFPYECGNIASKIKAILQMIMYLNSGGARLTFSNYCDQSEECTKLGGVCAPSTFISHPDDATELTPWIFSCGYTLSSRGGEGRTRASECMCIKSNGDKDIVVLIPS